MVNRRVWPLAALCCLALIGAACGDGEDEAGPPMTTAAATAPTTGTTGATATTETTTEITSTTTALTTTAAPTTTSWGVRADRTLVGPSGMTVDLSGCGAGWDDLAGVGAETIRVGASGPTSGPYASSIGVVAQGFQARLARANAAGGVGGRHVELSLLDDGWLAPETGVNATAQADEGVVAFAGTFGTNQGLTVAEVANARCIPQLAISAEARLNDLSGRPWTLATSGSWPAEMLVTVRHIAAEQPGGTRLVLVVEGDGEYGPSMQRAAETAVAKVPSVQLTTVVIPRDGSGIQAGLEQVVAASPTAVVVGLSERGGLPMINAIAGSGLAPDQRWVTSGTLVALRAAKQPGWRYVQTGQAPTAASTPFEAAYLEDAAALPADARGSFWVGYVQAEVLLIALADAAAMPGGVSRTNLLLALRSLDADHPGMPGTRLHTDGAADPWAIEAALIWAFDGTTATPIATVDVDGQTAG